MDEEMNKIANEMDKALKVIKCLAMDGKLILFCADETTVVAFEDLLSEEQIMDLSATIIDYMNGLISDATKELMDHKNYF